MPEIWQEYWSGSRSPLQGIFLTQVSNLDFLHCRWILYHLGHQGSSEISNTLHISFAVHGRVACTPVSNYFVS